MITLILRLVNIGGEICPHKYLCEVDIILGCKDDRTRIRMRVSYINTTTRRSHKPES